MEFYNNQGEKTLKIKVNNTYFYKNNSLHKPNWITRVRAVQYQFPASDGSDRAYGSYVRWT